MSLYSSIIGVYSVRGQNLENCLRELLINFGDAIKILDEVSEKIRSLPADAILLDLTRMTSTNLLVFLGAAILSGPIGIVGYFGASVLVEFLTKNFDSKIRTIDGELRKSIKQVEHISPDSASLDIFVTGYIRQKFLAQAMQAENSFLNFKTTQQHLRSMASSMELRVDEGISEIGLVSDLFKNIVSGISDTLGILTSKSLNPENVRKLLSFMKSSRDQLNQIYSSIKIIRCKIIEEIHVVRRSLGKETIDNQTLNAYIRQCTTNH